MHDIVKAVGNCSYNQLVEKIISCKQSDNSELAGEGECFLFTLSTFWPAWLPSSLPFISSLSPRVVGGGGKKTLVWHFLSILHYMSKLTIPIVFVSYLVAQVQHSFSGTIITWDTFTGLSIANTFCTKPQTEFKWNQDIHVATHPMTYFHSSQFSYQLSVTSPLKIFAHSTLSFLSSCQLGCCQVNTSRPQSMMVLIW